MKVTILTVDQPYSRVIRVKRLSDLKFVYNDKDMIHMSIMESISQKWCTNNGFIQIARANAREGDRSNIPVLLLQQNFRALSVDMEFNGFIATMKDTEFDIKLEKIFDLYTRLMTEVDKSFLDKYINNLYLSLRVLLPDGVDELIWNDRHINYPYLWVFYLIQRTLRNEIPLTISQQQAIQGV